MLPNQNEPQIKSIRIYQEEHKEGEKSNSKDLEVKVCFHLSSDYQFRVIICNSKPYNIPMPIVFTNKIIETLELSKSVQGICKVLHMSNEQQKKRSTLAPHGQRCSVNLKVSELQKIKDNALQNFGIKLEIEAEDLYMGLISDDFNDQQMVEILDSVEDVDFVKLIKNIQQLSPSGIVPRLYRKFSKYFALTKGRSETSLRRIQKVLEINKQSELSNPKSEDIAQAKKEGPSRSIKGSKRSRQIPEVQKAKKVVPEHIIQKKKHVRAKVSDSESDEAWEDDYSSLESDEEDLINDAIGDIEMGDMELGDFDSEEEWDESYHSQPNKHFAVKQSGHPNKGKGKKNKGKKANNNIQNSFKYQDANEKSPSGNNKKKNKNVAVSSVPFHREAKNEKGMTAKAELAPQPKKGQKSNFADSLPQDLEVKPQINNQKKQTHGRRNNLSRQKADGRGERPHDNQRDQRNNSAKKIDPRVMFGINGASDSVWRQRLRPRKDPKWSVKNEEKAQLPQNVFNSKPVAQKQGKQTAVQKRSSEPSNKEKIKQSLPTEASTAQQRSQPLSLKCIYKFPSKDSFKFERRNYNIYVNGLFWINVDMNSGTLTIQKQGRGYIRRGKVEVLDEGKSIMGDGLTLTLDGLSNLEDGGTQFGTPAPVFEEFTPNGQWFQIESLEVFAYV